MSFICVRMKNYFQVKGWALNLVLIQRPGGTLKWLIDLLGPSEENSCRLVSRSNDFSIDSFNSGSAHFTPPFCPTFNGLYTFFLRATREACNPYLQGWVALSMVSVNHWLSSIKTNTLSWYKTLVNATHASSNWVQVVITHASHVCIQHSFRLPLRKNGMQETQFYHARFGLLNFLPILGWTYSWIIRFLNHPSKIIT